MVQIQEKRRTALRAGLGLALCAAGLAGMLILAPFTPQALPRSQQQESSPAPSAPAALPPLRPTV